MVKPGDFIIMVFMIFVVIEDLPMVFTLSMFFSTAHYKYLLLLLLVKSLYQTTTIE